MAAPPRLTYAEIVAIERDHLVTTPIRPADLLFVFGTRHGVERFLDRIETLWTGRYFKWALVSGGCTGGIDASEATVLATGMIERGIPAHLIITEHKATNTGENVIFSLPLIEAQIGLQNVRSLIAVGKFHTSIRYLMTLQRHWPGVDKMWAPVHIHSPTPEHWYEHPELLEKVLQERAKIDRYKAAGFLADWPEDTSS